jgi:hypothetical protein
VVPGTADRVVDYESVDERTAVVCATGSDRKHLGPAAHQQDLLVAGMADELAAIDYFSKFNALCQIGAGSLAMILCHSLLPWLRVGQLADYWFFGTIPPPSLPIL